MAVCNCISAKHEKRLLSGPSTENVHIDQRTLTLGDLAEKKQTGIKEGVNAKKREK
jgi:hypothetical protein